MRYGLVVSDNTSLSALFDIGRIDLLRSLYECVAILTQVRDEFVATAGFVRERFLKSADWIEIVTAAIPEKPLSSVAELDLGEAAVIAFA